MAPITHRFDDFGRRDGGSDHEHLPQQLTSARTNSHEFVASFVTAPLESIDDHSTSVPGADGSDTHPIIQTAAGTHGDTSRRKNKRRTDSYISPNPQQFNNTVDEKRVSSSWEWHGAKVVALLTIVSLTVTIVL